MYLFERQTKLLEYLKEEKRFVTGSEIAKAFNISDRTVRTEIRAIKEVCGDDIIIAVRTKGYQYNPDSLSGTILYSLDITTPQDRILYITKQLIFHPFGIDVYDIADELFVSERTIETDITRIRKTFQDLNLYYLSLTRTGSILKIEGLHTTNINLLYDIAKNQLSELDLFDFQKIFTNINVDYLRFLITDILNAQNYNSRYLPLTRFVLDIVMIIESICHYQKHLGQFYNTLVSEFYTEIPNYYLHMGQMIAHMIDEKLEIQLDSSDIQYLTYILYINHRMHLVELEIRESFGTKDEFYCYCMDLFYFLREEKGISFIEGSKIIDDFILHLKIAIKRIELGISLYNPLLENFTTKYMHLIDIAIMVAERLEAQYSVKFNFNEISYIGVYLAIAFSSNSEQIALDSKLNILLYIPEGIGNLNLIHQQIARIADMQKITVDGITNLASNTQLQEVLASYPLIITTSQRFNIDSPNIFIIKGYLDDSNARKIKEIIQNKLRDFEELKIKHCISSITKESLFVTNLDCLCKEDIIHYLSNLLHTEGYVGSEFEHFVLQRESVMSTDLDSGIAFPHSLKNIANKTGMAIALLKEPILWNTHKVKVVCMYASALNSTDDSNLFIPHFMDYITEHNFVDALKNSKTYAGCCNTLLHYFLL